MKTPHGSPSLSNRVQTNAARWVLWGYVIISGLGALLHILIHFVEETPCDWVYLLPMAGISSTALFSLKRLSRSLPDAMFTFAWIALGCISILLVYQIEGNGNYLSIIPMFHIGIFTLGLLLGFLPALQYATAGALVLGLVGWRYEIDLGITVLYVALAYAAALPGKVVEQMIQQSTAELSAINLQLEELVEARTAELRAEISERKQAEEALRQRTTDLEKRNQELDAYAHTVAHDLKSPLASLIGFAELLEKRHEQLPGDKIPYYLSIIGQNGRKIVNIIDELLLLASVRKLDDVKIEPLDMAGIIQDALQRQSDIIREHKAEIVIAETWPVTRGYRPWVEEVVVNYVSNAIRYGGEPPVVNIGATDTQSGHVRLWVRDNGKGLTPEEQTHLFTPFTQLTRSTAKGHGLGLSIVQRIVEKLEGQVGVESTVGQGSTFYFTLPRATNDSTDPYSPT